LVFRLRANAWQKAIRVSQVAMLAWPLKLVQAYQTLYIGFTVAPIPADIDKFFHSLCNWDQYLAPWISSISPDWRPQPDAAGRRD
jgi:hypothetical protein